MVIRKAIAGEKLERGQFLSFFYGIAYWKLEEDIAICYPIPLHWIVGILRRWYFFCQRPIKEDRFQKRIRKAYLVGLEIGRNQGRGLLTPNAKKWEEIRELLQKLRAKEED